ncbi:hypothetical protein Mycsm_07190 (plasmid) [Mycobacterium sp. JS623]|uniref:hypothetical protein n=1 Tax=Mycobacterium sp. JS623 TaxID=212767 RepID=UPI0002A57E28|nr:hypothetical protein [Mycobacterium sp. JS623]AGB27284.1 hypothetical protein Mycsm_07190 [Mycobacterium sp. JS623]
MKVFIVSILAIQTLLFLALAFYTVHTTGSTDGLADIANSKLMWINAAALAVAAGLRRK